MACLVVDDHTVSREILVDLLSGFISIVEQCSSVTEALQSGQAIKGLKLILVDFDQIHAPESPDCLRRLSQHFQGVPVVVFGGTTHLQSAIGAIDAGAAGYLPRTMKGESMAIAIRLVLSGERFVPSFMMEGRNRTAFHMHGRSPSSFPQIRSLTGRQREVLGFVAQGAPNKVIARHLNLHEVTVKAHLRSIYRTLGVSSRTEAARTALLAGIDDGTETSPPARTVPTAIALPA